jgi:hypothetical protein
MPCHEISLKALKPLTFHPGYPCSTLAGGRSRRHLHQLLGSAGADTGWWLSVQATNFSNNTATTGCGGGLYLGLSPDMPSRLQGSLVEGCSAPLQGGGGLCVKSQSAEGHLLVNRTVFGRCTAQKAKGGAVLADLQPGQLIIQDSQLMDNAADLGGAVAAMGSQGGHLVISRTTAGYNSALTAGGFLHVACHEEELGSDCGTTTPIVALSSSSVSNSSAGALGGSVYVGPGASASLTSTTLTTGTAQLGGLVAGLGASNLTLANSTLVRGTAALYGGGIYAQGAARMLVQNSSLAGCKANAGGALAMVGPSRDTVTSSIATVLRGIGASWEDVANKTSTAAVVGTKIFNNSAEVMHSGPIYVRYRRHGAGVFVIGNASMLVSGSDLSGNNSAVVGAAVASLQRCSSPPSGQQALQLRQTSINGAVRDVFAC